VAHGDEPGVVDLLADDAEGANYAEPRRVDQGAVVQQRVFRFEHGDLLVALGSREPESVDRNRTGRDRPEFNQGLGRDEEFIAPLKELVHRRGGDPVLCVGGVREAGENARVQQELCHS
jgi:hypothetical protein